ncbi:MAG: NADH-quinone oxidoreductase subunit A [Chloroflexota bacterium]
MFHPAVLAQASSTPIAGQNPPITVVQNQENWLIIAIYFGLVLGIAVTMMLIPALLRPKNPNRIKAAPYESGMPPIGEAQARYTIRYYIVAMLFVVFDIEAVFFYPWAVAFNAIGWYGLIEMLLFIVLLLVAYVYAWRKGALDWVS